MAIRVRISFFSFKSGVELQHVSGMSMVNSFDDARQKIRQFAIRHHPEARDVTVQFERVVEERGFWVIYASSNIDTRMDFILIITKLGDRNG